MYIWRGVRDCGGPTPARLWTQQLLPMEIHEYIYYAILLKIWVKSTILVQQIIQ